MRHKPIFRKPARAIGGPPPKTSRSNALAAVAAIFAAYAAALLYAQGRTPPGLNNNVAEEALRAIYLVQGHHFEVIAFAVGRSAETLYLYLVSSMIHSGTIHPPHPTGELDLCPGVHLAGGDGGSTGAENPCSFLTTPGTYTITATPYSGTGGTGTMGTPLTVTITVTQSVSPPPPAPLHHVHHRGARHGILRSPEYP